ncbi:SCP2 sterol-binding domain-containing protein [Desulfosporosinus sp.]|uniref:SCP2 sterol-binding domain-containing protein n=1 Tax=Desulfosporosinus sp. TaxID=157907 RepID=UPI0023202C43|nr:SCP2 sterol-binding domain-containing protein [Desulfosporosinus sp.]MCO5385631.1 SCP2 sterol-binding domain-containing protein [Desulfosporosinus sp.]MDA8220366.1 SCP2 sterol-binding domain-containing protein [Desulfitobacterium hafniense]
MTVRAELQELVEKMNANPEHIASEKDRVFQINLEESGELQIVFKAGQVQMVEGPAPDPEVTLIMNEKNFSKLLNDKLNTAMAFMTGGLKVEGKLGLALKLQEIVKLYQ